MTSLSLHPSLNSNIISSKRPSLTTVSWQPSAPTTILPPLQFFDCHYYPEIILLVNGLTCILSTRAQTLLCLHTRAHSRCSGGDGDGSSRPLSTHLILNSTLSDKRQRPVHVCVCTCEERVCMCVRACTHIQTHTQPPPTKISPCF